MPKAFDILLIGAGPGGYAAAVQAARFGARAAIIEKQGWGGTCTHRGCVPTKALLACSQRFAELGQLRRMGVTVGVPVFDYTAMKRHQEQIVKISALGVRKSLEDAGVEMIAGEGRITAPGEVEWTSDGCRRSLSARDLVIAWGSEPALPPGVEPSARVLTSDGFLSLQALPSSILIVGGSVIGVEFATLLAELGVRVTLIELMPQLLPGEENEASMLLNQALKKMGVSIHTGVRMDKIRDTGSGVQVSTLAASPPAPCELAVPHAPRANGLSPAPSPLELSAEYALVCTGRKPLLREAELDALGIRHDRKGIAVDGGQMTSVAGIYAVGDVTGGAMIAHRAMHQGKTLAARLCGTRQVVSHEEAVPAVVYTHPPIARVGLTEEEARGKGFAVEIHRTDFGANITARTQLLGPGFVKLLFHGERLLGATVAGNQAGELIAPLSLAMSAGLNRKQLREWIIPHPTLSEVLSL